jgi:acetylornithine/N-succinyldiaminopimelate aminotransferase
VVYEKAFHGRSIATLSATGNPKVQKGFGPLVEGFIRVPLNDIEALKKATEGNPNVVAVFLETIQGEGGVNPMRIDYLQAGAPVVRRTRLAADDRRGAVRHGPHRQVVRPPVGRHQARRDAAGQGPGVGRAHWRCRGRPQAANIFQPGNHGTTFGGNPLAMRAGVETIRIMEEDGLLENAARVGAHLKGALERALADLPGVKEIRGQGLMIGVELTKPCGAGDAACGRQAGLLISVTADSVIRLVPPLIMTTTEADEVVAILVPLIQQFLAE